MKYMISWFERPQGSPAEYENAQKRILEVFGQWKAPAGFRIELFVVRVDEWGGHVLVDCEDPLAVSQVLLDVPGFRIPGATRDCRRRRSPGRTRSHRLARRAETQLTSFSTRSPSRRTGKSGRSSRRPASHRTADRPQPGGSLPLPWLCGRRQASRPPDRLLRRRPAGFRGGPPPARRHRQPAHGDPCRPGQGEQGPLRHALAETAGDAPALLAGGASQALAISGWFTGKASQHRCGGEGLPPGPAPLRHPQADYAPFATTRFRGSSARVRRRHPNHSTAAGSPQPGHHRPLPADLHQQGLFHYQPPGPAGRRHPSAGHARTTLSGGPMDRPKLEVGDLFRRYGEAYRQQHGASLSSAQRRVMHAIEVCRTAALGGHLEQCDQCGHERICYNSCGDRHCPKCQSLARAKWIQDRHPSCSTPSTSTWSSPCRSSLLLSPTRTRKWSTASCSGGGQDLAHHRRRPQAPGRRDRLLRRAAHLGAKSAASPASALRGHRWRTLPRWQPLDLLPAPLLPARAGAGASVTRFCRRTLCSARKRRRIIGAPMSSSPRAWTPTNRASGFERSSMTILFIWAIPMPSSISFLTAMEIRSAVR